MDEKKKCRLCFTVTKHGFEKIDELRYEMFDALSLKTNIEMDKDPVVCLDCMELAQKSFDFISLCYDTEELVLSCPEVMQGKKFELQDIVRENAGKENVGSFSVCRFCLSLEKGHNYLPLDALLEEDMFREMVPVCLSQIDFDIVRNPVICVSCKQRLERYLKFVLKTATAEKKTNTNIKRELVDDIDIEYSKIADETLKTEKSGSEDSSKEEVVGIEILDGVHEDWLQAELIQNSTGISEDGKYCCKLCGYQPRLKHRMIIHLQTHGIVKKMLKCSQRTCSFQTTNADELLAHKKAHKDETFSCPSCMYETKSRPNLKDHMKTHTEPRKRFACPECPYKASQRHLLKRHTVVHKDKSEVVMYRCELCPFETKYERSLKKHRLTHEHEENEAVFKCTKCPFKMKCKSRFDRHVELYHNSNKQTYRCEVCSFLTIHKHSFNEHCLLHDEKGKVRKHPCSKCAYVGAKASYLKDHERRVHGSVDVKRTRYYCDSCTYKTTRKRYLAYHVQTHRSVDRVGKCRCAHCEFETTDKDWLVRHMGVHQDSKWEIFKCTMCDFQTSFKGSLKTHVSVHIL